MTIKCHPDRYHYSMELEMALLDLFGEKSKWAGLAGGFSNVALVREGLKSAIDRIRNRIEQIVTTDDRLLLTTSSCLDSLEREIKGLKEDSNNELEIIAHMLNLVAHLLGYDWLMGEPNRHIIYYQTTEQEELDDRKRHSGEGPVGKLEFEKRLEIITNLYDQKMRVSQIARIMRLSEPMVKNILVRAGKVERKAQTKMT